MKLNNKIFNNFSWLLLNKCVNILAGLIASVIVTRYIGKYNNGLLSYGLSYCALFSAIAAMGADSFITKEFARTKDESGTIVGTSLLMLSIGSIVAFLLTNISTLILGDKEHAFYIFILSLQFITKPLVVFQYWFIGTSRAKYYSITQNLIHVICLIIKVILVYFRQDFLLFVAITSFEYILQDFGIFITYLINKNKVNNIKVDLSRLPQYIKICSPLILSSIAITIYMKFDQIMIGSMLGDEELGVYSIAVKLAEYWYFIPLILYNSFLPFLTKVYNAKMEEYYVQLQFFSDIQGLLGIVAGVGISFFSKSVVLLLYGKEFINAAPVLSIYCWAGLFVGLSYVKVVHCTNGNITSFQMISTIVGAIINIVLNAAFIPKWGGIGAAWSTVIAQSVSSIFVCIVYAPMREISKIQCRSIIPFRRLYKYIRKG